MGPVVFFGGNFRITPGFNFSKKNEMEYSAVNSFCPTQGKIWPSVSKDSYFSKKLPYLICCLLWVSTFLDDPHFE
jgi:hypothetical protein